MKRDLKYAYKVSYSTSVGNRLVMNEIHMYLEKSEIGAHVYRFDNLYEIEKG